MPRFSSTNHRRSKAAPSASRQQQSALRMWAPNGTKRLHQKTNDDFKQKLLLSNGALELIALASNLCELTDKSHWPERRDKSRPLIRRSRAIRKPFRSPPVDMLILIKHEQNYILRTQESCPQVGDDQALSLHG